MRKKTAHLQRIDEILARALKKRHVPFRAEDRHLADVWEKAVGPQIASQSRPGNLRKGILFVKVSSSVWMQQLHFLKEEIVSKLNVLEKAPIKDIRFSIGQLPSPGKGEEQAPQPLSTNLLKERDKKMMEDCLASLADQELKELIKRAMLREITWRRLRERKVP
ncbi:MAG TPA: DUF721 domain-containing protein [Syntrophales bacterium]|nr:DUF721 domain-containing protein [Syntrophales bacterium]